MKHFADTYNQIKDRLKPDSLITFDKGAYSKKNIDFILAEKMKYLTSKKLNKSDDKRIKKFDKSKAILFFRESAERSAKIQGMKSIAEVKRTIINHKNE